MAPKKLTIKQTEFAAILKELRAIRLLLRNMAKELIVVEVEANGEGSKEEDQGS